MALLELKNVSHIYHSTEGETEALKDISFSVEKGEFVAIVGPSGCGKSTLLSTLAGLIKPSYGNVLVNGLPISESRDKIALMPQRDQLFEWRSILKNVLLSPEIKRKRDAQIVDYAKNLLEKYGLKDFMNKRPSELSGGMRQRAALIRTLVGAPELLLLDEPFSALDFQTRLSVCDDVEGIIKAENKTAVLVTHDISEAISMSTKVIVLSKRPATIKSIYKIELDSSLPPLKRREQKAFNVYFRAIWKDLEVDDERRT